MVKRVRSSKTSSSDDFADIGTREYRQSLLSEFEVSLAIDKESLDEDIAQHSGIFYHVGKIVAILASRRDQMKKKKEEAEAEADLQIRKAAARLDEKITERQIESKKLQDEEVKRCGNEVLILNEELNIWGALKEAYIHRNYMLKEMTELYITQYYSSQSTTEGSRGARFKDIQADKGREAMSGERKRRSGHS